MARRRTNSGKFAENFAKSFSSTISALARAKYYDSLIDKNKGLSAEQMAQRLGGGSAASGASGTGGSGSVRGAVSTDPVSANMEPHQKAFLNAIAAPESGGRYDIRYTPRGGATFSSYDAHPGIKEPGPFGPSSAAGRYQFLKSTWDKLPAAAKGDGKFTPENQDRAALWYAEQQYKAQTGRSLDADLKEKGMTPEIVKALSPTWHGLKADPAKAMGAYNSSIKRYTGNTETAAATAPAATAPAAPAPAATAATAATAPAPAPAATAPAARVAPARSTTVGAVPAAPAEAPAETPVEAPAEVSASPASAGNLPLMARRAIPLGSTAAEVPAEVPAEAPAAPANESAIDTSYRGSLRDKYYRLPEEVRDQKELQSREFYGSFDNEVNINAASMRPQDGLHPPYYLMPENAYAEGGAVDEPTQEAPLEEAIGAALRGVQTEYGLGQDRAALPGSDPERQSDMTAFARNEGAMSPQEMKTVLSTVDPEGRMPRGEANALALQKLYNHYAKTGDEGMAQEAASSFVQGARANSMRLGSLAIAAMEQGDMAGAGKALIMSYDQIPDGRTVQGEVDQSGNGTINIVDTRTGKAVQQMQVTPQLLKMAAMKLSDGSEFYSHLSRMAPQKSAAPQRQAALPAYYTGGPVEDQDVDPAVDGEDAADAEVARDASLSASSEDDASEADLPAVGAVETSGTGSPGGAVPSPVENIDMTGMNKEQRDYASKVLAARRQVYAQEMQNYRQGEVTARQQQAEQNRQVYTSGRDDRRQVFTSERDDARAANTAAAASALAARQDRQATEREQRAAERRQYNDMTVPQMRAELSDADLRGKALQYRVGETDPTPREYALPAGVTGGSGQYSNPEETLTMPEGLNEPQTLGEKIGAISSRFDREFAASPGQKLRMTNARAASQKDREKTALSLGYRAYKKDRAKLELDLDTYFGDEKNGAFTRDLRADEPRPEKGMQENGKHYFGDGISFDEKASMKTWAFKLATANPDIPVTQAARAVVKMTGVDPKRPDASPNFVVDIDEKTGIGKVRFIDNSLSFNLDPESLDQALLYRKNRADYFQKRLDNPEKSDGKVWAQTLDWLKSLTRPAPTKLQSDVAQRRRETTRRYIKELGVNADTEAELSGALPVSSR